MSRLDRLRRVRREELSWRLGALGRIHRDRLVSALRAPRWNRRALASALAPSAVDPFLRTHLERGDWMAAQRALTRRLGQRDSLFALNHKRATELREAVLVRWPDAADDAARRASELQRGRFDILGYRNLSFSTEAHAIDWHFDPVHGRRAPLRFWADVPYLDPACGDHKVIWEANRHQHWLSLGRALWLTRDRTYGWTMIEQLSDWLAANPPLRGINWASMLELGFRSISWVWALHFLLGDAAAGTSAFDRRPWLVDLLVGLDRQLTHIEQNLSHYFSPNTHLTGEALALYVTGRSLPELAGGERWATRGRDILVREIDTQIGRDGGHLERSMHYHRYALDFYLLALLVAQRSGDEEAIGPFRDAASRLATFARGMADARGHLPTIGDDDGGMLWPFAGRAPVDVRDSLALAAVVLDRPELSPWGIPEEVFWLCGDEADDSARPLAQESAWMPSSHFADTGYVVLRDPAGDHLTFDAGAHGFLNGGHAHADALSVTLAIEGVPLLIDPGTATYTMDPALRDRFRTASSHNTMTIDGRSPSEPAGPFHWRSRTDASLAVFRSNRQLAWSEACHDGHETPGHRRSVVHAAGCGWLIVDEALGRGRHAAEIFWHFDPRWSVACESTHRLRAVDADGHTAWLLHDDGGLTLAHGDEDTGLGWCAPCYGRVLPTWSVRFSRHIIAPAALCTWIGFGDADVAPALELLRGNCDPAASAFAARLVQNGLITVTLLRPGDTPVRAGRSGATSEFHSDARLLQYSTRAGRVTMLAIADGSRAVALHEGLVSLASDERVDDLHVAFGGERVEVWASAPPSRLQIQGTAAARARMLRLNGREHPIQRDGRLDTIVVSGAAWGDSLPAARTTCVA